MVLINDAKVLDIPIIDSMECFIDLKNIHNRIIVDDSMKQIASSSIYFSYVRKTIAEKLIGAAAILPPHINFYIKEAYRPLAQQKDSFKKVLKHYNDVFSSLSDEEIYRETCKYVAPPECAPHPTGAAIDITLITNDNLELDMGTEFNATPQETENATYFHSGNISDEAKKNRIILNDALSEAGFVNYEPEWWHWSYGDRYWALHSQKVSALYSAVDEQWIEQNMLKNEYFTDATSPDT